MNIHHLELFYYVARHGGISEAVRNMPYGIQQPAVSGQILQLEDDLGVTLFQRRPFALSPSGQKLYDFIRPFFQNIQGMSDEIRATAAHHVRIGAAQIVLRDHLPEVLAEVRQKFPKLKLTLREGFQREFEAWLQRDEIDLAVTLLESTPPPGLKSQPLLQVPLVLLAPKNSRLKSADDLWKQDRIAETLLALPATEVPSQAFQRELARRKIEWAPAIELSSLELIQTYVENGYGLGLSVAAPGTVISKKLKVIPLDGFPPLTFGVLWQNRSHAVVTAMLEALQQRVATVRKKPVAA